MKKINPSPSLSHTARSFTKLNFAFSSPPHPSPLLKERENAVGLASVPRRGGSFRQTEQSEVSQSILASDSSSEYVGYIQNFPYNIICLN